MLMSGFPRFAYIPCLRWLPRAWYPVMLGDVAEWRLLQRDLSLCCKVIMGVPGWSREHYESDCMKVSVDWEMTGENHDATSVAHM